MRPFIKKLTGAFLTLLLYGAVSFFVLHLFMLGNGWFRETCNGFGLDRMLSFTADRPFAYRVLMPILVNAAALLVPQSFIYEHGSWLLEGSPLIPYATTSLFMSESMALKVHVIYAYSFLSLLFLLYAVREITRHVYRLPRFFSAAAPAAAVLLLPFTFRWGSHIYDFPELLLVALCLLCILKKNWLCYYPLYVIAILNKELAALLFLFFIALCRGAMPLKNLLRHVAVQMLIGAVLVTAVYLKFADHQLFLNSAHYLKQNFKFWFNPASYFLFWDPYRVGLEIFPRASNILFIYTAIFFIFYKWQEKSLKIKRLLLYASAVNLPLFLYAGWADEIRTLGLMFPGIYLLGVYSLYSLLYPSKPIKTLL